MEEKRQPGRPKKLRLVTIDTALKIIEKHFIEMGVNAADAKTMVPAKGTLYNKISKEIIKNHGSRKTVLLDESEIIEKLCS